MDIFTHIFAMQLLKIVIAITSLLTICFSLIIVPQYWQQQDALSNQKLKPGMRISTLHGIEGTICSINKNFIILEQDDGRKIEIIAQTIAKCHDSQ